MQENILVLCLDSCRYDTYMEAHTPHMDGVNTPRRVHSYSCWTVPSIFGYMMGFPPIGTGREDFIPPAIRYHWAPRQLTGMGYSTIWLSTNPITAKLNELTHAFFQKHWKYFRNPLNGSTRTLIAHHRIFIKGDGDHPIFSFILLMNTHQPYSWLDGTRKLDPTEPQKNFDGQVKAIEYIDTLFPEIMQPLVDTERPTHVIITSDHGELFGPHYAGHDPSSLNPKIDFSVYLYEIPLVEGVVEP